jgi:hypothetical protein
MSDLRTPTMRHQLFWLGAKLYRKNLRKARVATKSSQEWMLTGIGNGEKRSTTSNEWTSVMAISSDRRVHTPACPTEFWNSAFKLTYLESVDPSESEIDQIGFDCAAFQKWSSQSGPENVSTVRLGWGVIREWSSNFSGTREPRRAKLQPDCTHSLLNMPINFKQSNSRLQRYGAAVKTCMMKFALEDLLWMISMSKFWRFWINLLSNQRVQ